MLEAGGFSTQTLGEDRELTMALLSTDRRVRFEALACSRTEAPATLRAFVRQRFRWTYGTLQCAVKYLRCLFSFRAPGLGFLLLPDLLIFQTLVPCVSTIGLLINLLDPQPFELFLLRLQKNEKGLHHPSCGSCHGTQDFFMASLQARVPWSSQEN